MSFKQPVGIFDSGVGGLSIARCIRDRLPHENLLYIADSKHAPYGDKDQSYILQRCTRLIAFMQSQGAKAVVVACNTATVATISQLRQQFSLPIIGVEPAIKPAVSMSKSRKVGLLVTQRTANSESFHALVARYRADVEVFVQPCPGLVERVERGETTGPQVEQLLSHYIEPMLQQGVDILVLGCTHYPFLLPAMIRVTNGACHIIETGEAVAREVQRRLALADLLSDTTDAGHTQFFSSDELHLQSSLMHDLWGDIVTVQCCAE